MVEPPSTLRISSLMINAYACAMVVARQAVSGVQQVIEQRDR